MTWRIDSGLISIIALIIFLLGIGADESWHRWQEAHRPVPKQIAQSITTKDLTADRWTTDKEIFTAKDNKGNVIGTVTIEDRERIDTLNAASGVVTKERRRTVIIDIEPKKNTQSLSIKSDFAQVLGVEYRHRLWNSDYSIGAEGLRITAPGTSTNYVIMGTISKDFDNFWDIFSLN